MKSPACVSCKWGQGTVSEKQPDTQTAKEIQSNLNKILFERAQQDKMWSAPTYTSSEPKYPSAVPSSSETK